MNFLRNFLSRKKDETKIEVVDCSWPFHLPKDLYLQFKEYVLDRDYNSLLNSSKKFTFTRYETRQIVIKNDLVFPFMNDPVIQADILSKMVDPYYQLRICSDRYLPNEQTLELLSLPRCELSLCVSSLRDSCNIQHLLANRRKIILKTNHSKDFTDVLLSMESVSSLRLENFSALRNTTGLSNLQDLELIYCTEVTDVSCLSSLCKLTIISCPHLSDVSALGNIHWLKIYMCNNVQDITALNNNYYLSLKNNGQLMGNATNLWKAVYVDVDFFILLHSVNEMDLLHSRTKFLSLHYCNTSDNDLLILSKNLHTLSLSQCKSITHLDGLLRVPVIKMFNLPNLVSIAGLGENKSVTLGNCSKITDFGSLQKIPKVKIMNCSGFKGRGVEEVHHLILADCSCKDWDFALLTTVYHLELITCSSIKNSKSFKEIPIVEIVSCGNLEILAGLGRNKKIIMSPKLFEDLKKEGRLFQYFNSRYHIVEDKRIRMVYFFQR
jgi:hypothetical protein